MNLNELADRAMKVRTAYAAAESARYGRSWTREEVALGFVGDVGDLMKLIQAAEGVRSTPDWQAGLAHELADCLWCVLVLSRLYGVDLSAAFVETMASIEASLAPF